jgi:hypothetical protein
MHLSLAVFASLTLMGVGHRDELIVGDNRCGPISAFGAARSLGIDASWGEIIERTMWRSGQKMSVAILVDALESYEKLDVACRKVRLEELDRHLRSGTAILLLRTASRDIDHAICVLEDRGDSYLILSDDLSTSTLEKVLLGRVWSGETLLVSRSDKLSVREYWAASIAPAVVLLYVIAAVVNRPSATRSRGSGPYLDGKANR